MRLKLAPRFMLFAVLCVYLTIGGMWLRNALGFNTGQIVFTSRRDGTNEIYVMDSDGKNPIRLTDNPANVILIQIGLLTGRRLHSCP